MTVDHQALATSRLPSPLAVRVISGGAILGVFLLLIYVGRLGVYTLALAAALLSLWEFGSLTRRMGVPAALWLLLPLGLYVTVSGTLLQRANPEVVLAVAALVGLTLLTVLPGSGSAFVRWSMAVGGALYIGLPLNYYLLLYTASRAHGLAWILVTILAVVASDVAALLVGRRLGRRPFFQNISPSKTLEGAIAGALSPVIVTLVGGYALLGLSPVNCVALGLLIGAAAELGDLVESQLKRRAGVKDSSHLIPGHGGVLDRIDSILFPGVVVYLYAAGLNVL